MAGSGFDIVTSTPRRQLFHRSYLYVSGSQPRRIEQAYESGADAIVIDLEDSVPAAQKDFAREVAAAYTAGVVRKPTYVRVNSMRSGRCEDDVQAVVGPGLSGVRLAKTQMPQEVEALARVLTEVGSPAVIHLLFESAYGLETAYESATAAPAVGMIGIGEYDLRAELNCALDGVMMDACRTTLIRTARAAGLPSPSQGVYPDVYNLEDLLASSQHGKALGFMGRMAIHPVQIPTIHEVYTPTADEVAMALEICEAADLAEQRESAIVYTEHGHMVAPPIIAAAREVVRNAQALKLVDDPRRPAPAPGVMAKEERR